MKSEISDLALLGGKATFDQPLHIGRPNLPSKDRFFSYMDEVWESRWLSNNGPKVQAFERALEARLDVRHCIAVCNATVALEIAIRAMNLHGEVIVPSFTFIATAHSVLWQGLKPVFCDVDPVTHCLDPVQIERCITDQTTGIIPVHLWGNICPVEAIDEIAKRYQLAVLYDASHAIGCSHRGTPVANFGDAEVFSFHATKVMNTFEGGCITTNNDDLARRIRLMKNFGFVGKDNVTALATNGKMNEMSAAMGLASLEQLDDFIAHSKQNYQAYRQRIRKIPGLTLMPQSEEDARNFHYVVVQVDAGNQLHRDQIVRLLEAEGVLARRYFHPGCHRMSPYNTLYPDAGKNLAVTERLAETLLCLPNGTATQSQDVEAIAELLEFIQRQQSQLAAIFSAMEQA